MSEIPEINIDVTFNPDEAKSDEPEKFIYTDTEGDTLEVYETPEGVAMFATECAYLVFSKQEATLLGLKLLMLGGAEVKSFRPVGSGTVLKGTITLTPSGNSRLNDSEYTTIAEITSEVR